MFKTMEEEGGISRFLYNVLVWPCEKK